QNPPKKARIFWGAAQGAVAIVLVLAAGEATLKALQTASVMAAFPFMFVLALMCIAIVRAFKGEFDSSIGDIPMFDKAARAAAKARKEELKAAAQKAAEEEAAAE
ncbi:MAG: BCCT family transporter, partial [Bacillota bacterium]|nr:BCCT family transporter [Bacillota bacterium]